MNGKFDARPHIMHDKPIIIQLNPATFSNALYEEFAANSFGLTLRMNNTDMKCSKPAFISLDMLVPL